MHIRTAILAALRILLFPLLQDFEGDKEKEAGDIRPRPHQTADERSAVPWDALRLSVTLLLIGLVLLVLGALHLSKHIIGKDGAVSIYPH